MTLIIGPRGIDGGWPLPELLLSGSGVQVFTLEKKERRGGGEGGTLHCDPTSPSTLHLRIACRELRDNFLLNNYWQSCE